MKKNLKFGAGILVSLVFMYLAFRKADLGQTVHSLKTANYLYLIPAVAVLFLSHYLRAFRWRYLLDPIRRLDMKSLFSSLIIGYMANAFTPAHLAISCEHMCWARSGIFQWVPLLLPSLLNALSTYFHSLQSCYWSFLFIPFQTGSSKAVTSC